MTEKEKEKMLELLSDRAVFGLTEEERNELAELEKNRSDWSLEAESLELAAAAVQLVNLEAEEQLPAHLRARVVADADRFFAARATAAPERPSEEEFQKTFAFEPKRSVWQWLGWAVAGAACLLLAINVLTTRVGQDQGAAATPTPTATPAKEPTLAEQRERLLASAPDAVQSSWTDFPDPKRPKFGVEGDVVWSNSAQKGFIRFRNLPVNDKNRETYQLWIFDKAQKNPVSGGVFDIGENGEVIVPIDAAIRVQEPTMFGVTAEKPGGVMVSGLEKVLAVAKIEI